MKKLSLAEQAAILTLAATLTDPDVADQITIHELESPFEEEDGKSMVVITCTGDFRELIECRKAILRDVVKTLRLAQDKGI